MKGSIPRTHVGVSESREQYIVDNILLHSQVLFYARMQLSNRKLLTQKIAFRIAIELNLCANLLKGAIGLSQQYCDARGALLVRDKEGKLEDSFIKEVDEFCEALCPSKPVLISGPAVSVELRKLRGL